jgi:hypothetical protein
VTFRQPGPGQAPSTSVTGTGPFTVSGSHNYASTGFFTITVSVMDDRGSTISAHCQVLIFATAAAGNFVIGEGNAAVRSAVTFVAGDFSKPLNAAGVAPPLEVFSFDHYAPQTPPVCGTAWSTVRLGLRDEAVGIVGYRPDVPEQILRRVARLAWEMKSRHRRSATSLR